MSDSRLNSVRHGRADGAAGVRATPLHHRALATLVAGRGQTAALAERIETRFGLCLPTTPRRVSSGSVAIVGVGPGRWLAMDETGDGLAFETALVEAAAGHASATDQSDGLVLLRLSGPDLRRTLAKGIGIDLHPAVFRLGDAATTPFALIGTTLWRIDGGGHAHDLTVEIAVARSYAADFLHALTEAAAEFGFDLHPTARG